MLNQTSMDLAQFLVAVNDLFGGQMPTSEAVRHALVPLGAINIAWPGSFGSSGIYKYEYTLACGTYIIVKCHKRHASAAGGPNCNSARFATVQLYVGRSGRITDHVVWDNDKKEAKLISKATLWRSNEAINWSHIPVQWNSHPVSQQPSTWGSWYPPRYPAFFSFKHIFSGHL